MLSTTIALNRFGLGARPDDQPPSDPKRWLLQQLERFDARPQALAQVPARTEVVEQLGDYIAAQQMAGRAKRQLQAASLPLGSSPQPQQSAADPQSDELKKYLRQTIQQDYLVMNSARLDSAAVSSMLRPPPNGRLPK